MISRGVDSLPTASLVCSPQAMFSDVFVSRRKYGQSSKSNQKKSNLFPDSIQREGGDGCPLGQVRQSPIRSLFALSFVRSFVPSFILLPFPSWRQRCFGGATVRASHRGNFFLAEIYDRIQLSLRASRSVWCLAHLSVCLPAFLGSLLRPVCRLSPSHVTRLANMPPGCRRRRLFLGMRPNADRTQVRSVDKARNRKLGVHHFHSSGAAQISDTVIAAVAPRTVS